MRDRFRLILVLSAVMLAVPSIAPADQPGAWTTVRDGRESAFSIDVPKGWATHGGMFRFGYVDARPFVDATSRDGTVNLRVGDATIPSYTTPNRWFPSAPAGPHVAAYASGDVFASKYGRARFAKMCASPEVISTGAMAPKYHDPGKGSIRVTAGQAILSCMKDGRKMAGYVYAETLFVGSAGPSSNWYVIALGSFLAPAAQAKAAGALLKHMGESLALNPQWAAAQQQRVNQATQVYLGVAARTAQDTAAMNARQAQWSKMMRGQSDAFNDVLNDVTFTRDPLSGQEREVPTGLGRNKWIDGGSNVVDSTLSPGPGFHQLQTVSR